MKEYLYFPYGPYGLYRVSVLVQGCALPYLYVTKARCYLWLVPLHHIYSTLPHKWIDFQENIVEHKMRVFTFSTTFV